MTAPDRIIATTEQGTGLVLPIAKAMSHVMTVYTAIAREWPLSARDAAAELEDAAEHLRSLHVPRGLMTSAAEQAVDGWIGELSTQTGAIRITDEDAALTETLDVEQLKQLATDTWQLITQLDRELTGLNPNQADPGQLP